MLESKDNIRTWHATLLLCALLALGFGANREWHNLAMYGVIYADAQGYYGYLVAAFLERSFDWEQVIASYNSTYFNGGAADFTVMTDAGRVNKYFAGTAILMMPGFFLSCLAAIALGHPVDGYSVPFHVGMMLSALTYMLAGLWLLGSYLRSKGFRWSLISVASLGAFAGTGLFYYTVMEPGMSHVYSFFLFCAFIYRSDRAVQSTDRSNLLWLATITALIALVRPTNAVIVLSLPFIAGGWVRFISFLGRCIVNWRAFLPAVVLAICIICVQPIMYLVQVGRPMVWSYSGEGFNFLSPEMFNVLFSFRKGLFVYYPWTLLASLGLLTMIWRARPQGIWLSMFLGISVYVVSSWWCWYYGSSLGMRAMIDYLPFFILLMVHLLSSLGSKLSTLVMGVALLTIPVNLVQAYQYNKFILHWDQMDQERFWQIFMKTDSKYSGIFYREAKVMPLPPEEQIVDRHILVTDMESDTTAWGTHSRTSDRAFSGRNSALIDESNPYGPTLRIPFSALAPEGRRMLVATFTVWSSETLPALSLAYSIAQGDRQYAHTYLHCGDQVTERERWMAVRIVTELPKPDHEDDFWVVYPFTTGNDAIFIDDMRLEVLTLKD
jgi:hypothetical protein